jgi:DedD protein
MAFFKFGSNADANAKTNSRASKPSAEPETVEVLRRRARQRLIGASALVLLGVIGFPLLFDSQPRPIAVDIPISIPDKNKTAPLAAPASPAAPKASAPATAKPAAQAPSAKVADAASLAEKEEILKPNPAPTRENNAQAATETIAKTATKTEAKPTPKPEPKPEAKPEAKPTAKAEDAAKAKSLLEGQNLAAAQQGRFIVQVGAFADVEKARETRLKVERAGLKTYTQVVETSEGKRIRVRVGPFANKAEADKAASTIKGLDLPASILTL